MLTLFDDTHTGLVQGVERLLVDTGSGSDTILVNNLAGLVDLTEVVLVGGTGHDTIDGSLQADATLSLQIFGGQGTDSLVGGAGNDLIDGSTQNDTVRGLGGNDTLIVRHDVSIPAILAGGSGNDTLRGGGAAGGRR